MIILNLILSVFTLILLTRSRNYFAACFFLLVLFFNYIPISIGVLFLDEIQEVQDSIIDISFLNTITFLWIVGFFIGTIIFKGKKSNFQKETNFFVENNKIRLYSYIVIILSIIIFMNNLVYTYNAFRFGYMSVYSMETGLVIKNTTIFPFIIFFGTFLLKSIKSSNKITKNSSLHITALVLYFVSMLMVIIFGGRSNFIYFLIINCSIIYANKKFKPVKLLLIGSAFILFISVIGMIREGDNLNTGSGGNIFLRPFFELSQTGVVLLNATTSLKVDGMRYFELLLSSLPNFIVNLFGIKLPENLAQTYVNTIDPLLADSGGGYGFSILAELFLIGGKLGVFFGSFVLAFSSIKISQSFQKRNYKVIAFSATIGFYVLILPRGEFYEIYRPFFVAVALFLFSKISFNNRVKSDSFNIISEKS